MKARKGCWTCTARKIQCDGGLPTCQKCVRGKRDCQGYDFRLSWPKDGDRKRAITSNNTTPAVLSPEAKRSIDLAFVNASSQDMELYGYSCGRSGHMHSRVVPRPSPKLRKQPQQEVSHVDLVHYFYTFAHLSLVTFCQSPSQIRNTLLSMALAQEGVPGSALFYSLLAYSSLHRYGLNSQAVQLKIRALQFLSASMPGEPLVAAKAAQHVAASMLLGAFEILQPAEGSSEWLLYTRGAMDIIQATQLKDEAYESDTGHLLNWVQYHETISHFTISHWRRKSLLPPASIGRDAGSEHLQYLPSSLTTRRPKIPSVNPSFAILNLLSEITDTLVDPTHPRSRDMAYQENLARIRRRIKDAPTTSPSTGSTTYTATAVQMYQMATEIYLVRASQSPWEPAADLDSLIDAAFAGPVQSCNCEHFFPMLVLACEAQNDEQRVAIVNLLERTQRDAHIRSIQDLKNTIQSIWVQQDLHKDSDILVDYLGVMSAAVSSSNSLVSFA